MRAIQAVFTPLVLACIGTIVQAQPIPIRVEPVRTERIGATAQVTGSLRAIKRSGVASQEAGQVSEVLADVGNEVAEGDVLVHLDRRRLAAREKELEAEIATAEARLREAESNARYARTDLKRIEVLHQDQTASEIEFVRAQTASDAAEALSEAARRQVDRVRAEMQMLQVRLDDLSIRAPFAGHVVARHVDPGEWLAVGGPALTLVSSGPLEAWLEVPERYLADPGQFKSRMRVESEVGAMTITNVRIQPEVDPRVRTFMVIATVTSGTKLSPGMSVKAWIPTNEVQERLTLHKDALIRDAAGFVAFVVRTVNSKSAVTPLPVRVDFEFDDRVAIRPGSLKSGDLVVVEGNERLYAGAEVTVNRGSTEPVE